MTLHTRDQERALLAYEWAEQARAQKVVDAYKVRVNALGANVLRNGLVAALAFLERDRKKEKAAELLLGQLADASLPGISKAKGAVPVQVRELPLDAYLLATREVLQLALWMRRAVQATFTEPGGEDATRAG